MGLKNITIDNRTNFKKGGSKEVGAGYMVLMERALNMNSLLWGVVALCQKYS